LDGDDRMKGFFLRGIDIQKTKKVMIRIQFADHINLLWVSQGSLFMRCSVEDVGFNLIGYLIMMVRLILRPMQGMIE
jgi:hypothetical protein